MTSDNPYLLSLDNCGADTLLLQGTWPDAKSATTYIEGQDGVKLDNLAIVNTSGSPTITTDCQLKATVNRGKAGEKSTLMPLTIKDGTITLSNANMLEKNVELDIDGVLSNEVSAILIGKKETSTADGVTRTAYRFVAMSDPLKSKIENGKKLARNITLYKPPQEIRILTDEDKISNNFESGDYLISVANLSVNVLAQDIDITHASAIKFSK